MASQSAAWARPPAAVASLPIGSPLTIVSDETVDPRVRPGSEFRAHLRDPLTLGDTLVATAGTPARIVIITKDTATDGSPRYRFAIVGLNLGLPGILPVRPVTATVPRIAAGMAIPATTLAEVAFDQGKVRVAVPLPFPLSNESPNGGYTAAPLRTAAPIMNDRNGRRRRTPAPVPPSTPPSPAPTASGTTPGVPPTNPPSGATPSAVPLPAPT